MFAAKKTAALSGDVRKAFQLCRSAAQLVSQRFEREKAASSRYPRIRIGDIQKASLESFNMAMVTAVSFAAAYEVLLLVSLASLCRSTGREVGGFDIHDILVKMEALANAAGDPQYTPPPSFDETLGLLTRLGEVRNCLHRMLFSCFRTDFEPYPAVFFFLINFFLDLASDESGRAANIEELVHDVSSVPGWERGCVADDVSRDR